MYDAVIVGGGHNALVCGAYLAKAGRKAVVLERRSLIGGACVTEESWPGFKVSTASYVMSLFQPRIILDLELKKHGLEVMETTPTFTPALGNRAIVFWGDDEKFSREIAVFSKRDAEAYPKYRASLARLAPAIREVIWDTPPNLASTKLADLARTARFFMKYRKYGPLFYELYDILTMSAYDYLSRWFESEEVIAALGYYVQGSGTNASMKSPATAFTCIRPMLRDHATPAGPGGFVRGGMGGLTDAIARSGTAHGLEIRTQAEVSRILTSDGEASGVALASGEIVQGKCVIANAHAKTTFLKLLPEEALPEDFLRKVRSIRTRSSVFKVHLGVTALPHYTAFSAERCGFPYPVSVRFGDSVGYLEKAFDDIKGNDVSEAPFLAVMVPSLRDHTLAPEGMHLVSIFGGHVVYEPDESRLPSLRAKVLAKVLSLIERHAPGFRQHVVHSEVLTPRDLELRFDLHGGHVHHGDLTIDQAFFRRPVGGFADYRTPIKRLYLASSSAHPGGGVTGVPGYNAAREILKDLRH